MSVSTEVQRTLVKSPPELWSELSNPDALARHLSELGEIRITAVEPETKVEWEAAGASGVVQLKQSGWGTKVTLSVTRAAPPSEEAPSEPEAIAGPEPETAAAVEAERGAVAAVKPEPESELAAESSAAEPAGEVKSNPEIAAEPNAEALGEVALESEPLVESEPQPVAEPEPEPVATVAEQETVTEPDTRPGFFARLFRRGHARRRALAEALAEFDAVTEPELKIEVVALAAPEPVYPEPAIEPGPEPEAADLAAELASVEAQMTAETTKLLTGVLDRLGAAHHRPFSRG